MSMRINYKVRTLISTLFNERSDKIIRTLEKKGIVDTTLKILFEDYLGYKYFHFEQIGSTQDFAKEIIRKQYITHAIVRADVQLSGRGRFYRRWYSPKGGLWFSILEHSPSRPELISFILPLTVVISLRTLYGVNAQIKWPNDVMLYEKKVSGVLIESLTHGKEMYVISGVGINCNNDPPIEMATSLKNILKREISLEELFLTIILLYVRLRELKDPIELFKAYCNSIGRYVRIITTKNEEIEGILRDITSDGYAQIELPNGNKLLIHTSQVTHVLTSKDIIKSVSFFDEKMN